MYATAYSIEIPPELQKPRTGKRGAGGVWWAAYGRRNHDIGRYHSLNLIFSTATAT
jgi:hypothetical protein